MSHELMPGWVDHLQKELETQNNDSVKRNIKAVLQQSEFLIDHLSYAVVDKIKLSIARRIRFEDTCPLDEDGDDDEEIESRRKTIAMLSTILETLDWD